jgi:hypothetical protein
MKTIDLSNHSAQQFIEDRYSLLNARYIKSDTSDSKLRNMIPAISRFYNQNYLKNLTKKEVENISRLNKWNFDNYYVGSAFQGIYGQQLETMRQKRINKFH